MPGFADSLRHILAECASNMERAQAEQQPRVMHEDLVTAASGRLCMLLMDASAAEIRVAVERLA